MRAGNLRNKITIEQKTVTQDENGDLTETWSTFATPWARIEPLRGREFLEARAINNELTVRFYIRYRAGVTQDMRIRDADGNLYDITAPLHINHRNRELQIMAESQS